MHINEQPKKPGETPAVTPRSPEGTAQASAPPLVREALRTTAQPLDAHTRAAMEPRFGHDFSQVRVHTGEQAAAAAKAVQAAAFTVGRDLVFGAGQYSPGTDAGKQRLAHELAHTLQQRMQAGPAAGDQLAMTAPTDAVEKEAELAAAGPTALGFPEVPLQVARQPARPGSTQAADPFASETPALRTRRQVAIRGAQDAIENLRTALSRGYVWDFETVTADGVNVRTNDEAFDHREARLKQLMVDLALMSSELQTAPVPAAWLAPEVASEGGVIGTESTDPTKRDVKLFYAHRAKGRGEAGGRIFNNMHYIDTAPVPKPAVRRAPTSAGSGLGIYITVPDPKNAPLVYQRVTGYEGWQAHGTVLEVWSDDVGYYYHGKLGNVYLPGKP